MELISGGIAAQAISAAAELGIADLLATGSQTTKRLAMATGTDAEKLYRLLRYLASLGVFTLGANDAWGLTPLAEVLRSEVPGSMRAGARMLGRMSSVTPHLLENVRTGQCAYHLTFGKPIFEDLSEKLLATESRVFVFRAERLQKLGREVRRIREGRSPDRHAPWIGHEPPNQRRRARRRAHHGARTSAKP